MPTKLADSKKYEEWRNKALAGIPELAARVFALRRVKYNGYGFHYGLEARLGKIIALLNDYETIPSWTQAIIDETALEGLYYSVEKAEKSVVVST